MASLSPNSFEVGAVTDLPYRTTDAIKF